MRTALILLFALGVAACDTAANIAGSADYDSLKRAHDNCAAKGGTLVLKDGGDSQYIDDYSCKVK
jgi:hypothetical protein